MERWLAPLGAQIGPSRSLQRVRYDVVCFNCCVSRGCNRFLMPHASRQALNLSRAPKARADIPPG